MEFPCRFLKITAFHNIKMIKNIGKFDPCGSVSFGTWLITIAENCYIDHLRHNGLPYAANHRTRKRRSGLDNRRARDDRVDKIQKIRYHDVRGSGGECACREYLSEGSDCPLTPMLALERRTVDQKSNGLFFPVRTHAVIGNRSVRADRCEPEIWFRRSSSGGAYRLFEVISLCAFSVGCAGIGSDRRCHRRSGCHYYEESDLRLRRYTLYLHDVCSF